MFKGYSPGDMVHELREGTHNITLGIKTLWQTCKATQGHLLAPGWHLVCSRPNGSYLTVLAFAFQSSDF